MPYIKKDDRKLITEGANPNTAGQLTYAITMLLVRFIQTHKFSFDEGIIPCVGALECAKLELYRRKVAGYEDTKIEQNGDVYLG